MDGVSGAASVATLLTIVLNIHSFISKLKNGPKFAQQTLKNLNHLRSMLQHLENLPGGSLQTSLTQSLQECEVDLNAFHEKLQKLNINASVKRISWKNVRIKLKEEDIRQVSDAIDDHYQKLTLELQVIELHHGQAHAANLQNLSMKMDSHSIAQQEATNLQQNILSTFNSLQAAAVTWQQQNLSSASRLDDVFEEIRNLLQNHLSKDQTNRSTQTDNETTASTAASDATPEAASPNTHTAHPDLDRKVQNAIDILHELVGDEGTCRKDQEAERLLAETQHLFELLRQSESEERLERSAFKSTKRKMTDNDLEEDVLFDRELKKLRAVFLSETVNINMKGRNPRGTLQSNGGSELKHVMRRTPLGIVTLQVRSSKDQENERSSRLGSANIVRAMFEYLPHNKRNPWIGISLARQRMQESCLLINPSLVVSNIMEYGSLGFELILRGNLEDFRKSLSRRDIRLNDRDPDGRSYLHYALFATQPEMCLFLIENGADVDFAEPNLTWTRSDIEGDELMTVELDPDVSISERINFNPNAKASERPSDYCGSLVANGMNLFESDIEYQRACNRCHQYLLEANADPSVKVSSFAGIPTVHLLDTGNAQSVRQLIDLGLHHSSAADNLSSRDWLQVHLSSQRWTFESVELLFSRQGTNGFPLQNLEGCLHEAIQGSEYASTADIEEVLVLLVKAGANTLEQDSKYGTVSDLACSATTFYWCTDLNGRVRNHDFVLRELWSRALTRCGIDAEDVIETSRLSEGRPGANTATDSYLGLNDDEESEIDDGESEPNDDASENASDADKCETISDKSEEDGEENNEIDDSSNEQPASPGAQMEVDPQERNPFSLSSENWMLLEQDSQVWTE